ncbi:hypothetical protein [Rhizobium leguminosarum]|uniref:hypothetical protein n=1 Tax=Rhizobium leguminosarum TaxID=384 RepID=UPI001FE163EE|nr:hypothetical protein [Rhizobium leguminosarum]
MRRSYIFDLVGEKVTPVALELQALDVPFVLASAVHPTELAVPPVLAGVANSGKPTDLKRLVDALKAFQTRPLQRTEFAT